MNSSIELHDSTIGGTSTEGRILSLHFARAYLHMSIGRPGVDAGSGWVQEAKLTFLDAETHGSLPELPANVVDGELFIDEQRFRNKLPLPLNTLSVASLNLIFDLDHSFTINGTGVRLELIGVPRYVEEFPGENH